MHFYFFDIKALITLCLKNFALDISIKRAYFVLISFIILALCFILYLINFVQAPDGVLGLCGRPLHTNFGQQRSPCHYSAA